MQKMNRFAGAATVAALAAAVALSAAPASAQRGGGQGRQNGGGWGGPGGFRMQRPKPMLATTPVAAMTPYFDLTAEQAQKIEELQKGARKGMEDIGASFQSMRGQFGNNQNPSAQDREQMRAQMQQMRTEVQSKMEQVRVEQAKAEEEIGRVLTSEQRPRIASFLRDVEILQRVSLPLELIKPLDLTGPQKRKLQVIADDADEQRQQQMQQRIQQMIGGRGQNNGGNAPGAPGAAGAPNGQDPQAMGRQIGEAMRTSFEQTREKALAVLTPEQKALVEKWEKEHPNAGRGRMGGFGGPNIQVFGGPGNG